MPKKKSKNIDLKYSVIIIDKDINETTLKFNKNSELYPLFESVSWNTLMVLPTMGSVKQFIQDRTRLAYHIREWEGKLYSLLDEIEDSPHKYCELSHKIWLINRLLFTLRELEGAPDA